MFWKVLCVVFIGFIAEGITGDSKDKLHIKVVVPSIVHKHTHKKIVYVKPKKLHLRKHPLASGPKHHSYENGFYNVYKHQSTSKPSGKKRPYKSPRLKTSFTKPILQRLPKDHSKDTGPHTFGPHGYKNSYRTMKSEKFETETIDNPLSTDPFDKYIVKSSYKIREKLPYDDATIGYDHAYEHPLSEYEYDFHNDNNNGRTEKIENLPKHNFEYKFPSNDHIYERNVAFVDYYLNKNQNKNYPDFQDSLEEEPKKTEEYEVYEEDESDLPQSGKSSYEHGGPSERNSKNKYEIDGPSYEYF